MKVKELMFSFVFDDVNPLAADFFLFLFSFWFLMTITLSVLTSKISNIYFVLNILISLSMSLAKHTFVI